MSSPLRPPPSSTTATGLPAYGTSVNTSTWAKRRCMRRVCRTLARIPPLPCRCDDRSAGDRMLRIGLVCPYSLTVPGGVQAQVLGLARELRRQGHEARVLGPCDGPPPEAFVTPLGNSLPTAANGSIAPLAPDASAALRTIRALNDEAFDVIHVHEPMVPGPPMTALIFKRAPTVGTFHAAGRSAGYQVFYWFLKWVGRAHRPQGRRLQGRPRAGPVAPRRRLRHPLQRRRDRRDRRRRADADEPSDDLLLRSPRGAQGPGGPARGVHRAARRRAPVDRQRRARWAAAAPAVRRRRPHHLARADQRRREVRPPARGGRALRAVAARGVVRRRADRGDGGRARRSWRAASTATATWRPTASTPCSSSPATPAPWPRRSARCSATARLPTRCAGRPPPGRRLLDAHPRRRVRPPSTANSCPDLIRF